MRHVKKSLITMHKRERTNSKQRDNFNTRKMKFLFYVVISFLLTLAPASDVFSQIDTASSKMSFDFGLTRGNNFNLLPLYKRIKTKEKKEVDILFPIYGSKHDYISHSKRSHLFPVYWSDSTSNTHDFRFLSLYYPSLIHISRERSNDLHSLKIFDLAPEINFLEFTRSADGQYIQNNLFFFLWYNNNKVEQKSHLIFFPLYWSFRNKENYSNTLLPFYSAGTTHHNQGKYLAVTPFFWHFNENEKTKNILFPLWWSSKSVSGANVVRSNTLFPVYWSHKDSSLNRKVLFPLLWSYATPKFHSFTVFPVFFKSGSADKSYSNLMITPFFLQKKNDEDRRAVLFPIWWHEKTGSGENTICSNTLFPVYWSHKDGNVNRKVLFPFYWSYNGYGNDYKVLFPFIWKFKNPLYSSLTVFPFISQGISSDSSASHTIITPFFWHTRNHENVTNILFPFWWNNKSGSGKNMNYTNVIFPFLWQHKDTLNQNEVIFPFVWNHKDTAYSYKTLVPFFSSGHSPDSARSHLMITPLFWNFKNGEASRTILFPLYYSYKNSFKDRKILFPLFWIIKDTAYNSVTVAPLFSSGHSLDHKTGYVMATPLFWHLKDPEGYRNILFPLWWNRKIGNNENAATSNVVFPVYWSYKDKETTNRIIFPVVWRLKNKNYSSITVAPLFSSGHTADGQVSHLMITPFYWHLKEGDKSRNILFPFYWGSKSGTGENTVHSNVLFPVYCSFKQKDSDTKIVFPFIWSFQNARYRSFTFLPFFSGGNSLDHSRSHFMVTPFFWHFRNGDDTKNILFPLLWNRKIGTGESRETTNVLFPVYWSHKDKETTNKIIFPLVWSLKNKKYSSITVAPLFSSGHTPDGQVSHLMITPFYWHLKEGDKSSDIFFPLYWGWKSGTGEDAVSSNVFFPVFWSFKKKDSDIKILFPMIGSVINARYHSFTFLPFYSTGSSTDNSKSHFMVTPLFWHFRNGDDTKNILFPLWWNYKNGSGEDARISHIVFPVFWSFKGKAYNTKIVFPIIWEFTTSHYRSFTLFPLVSFGHSPESDRKHFVLTPFFWSIHRTDSRRVTLFPLFSFYDSKSGTSDFNILYILFHSHKEPALKTAGFLLPICEYEKRPEYTYFRFAPLIWYKNSPNDKYFSIQPFFYHSKDSVSENYNFLWQLFVYKNRFNVKKSENILWKAISRDKYSNGDHEFRILYFVYANMGKGGRVEHSLFPLYQSTKDTIGNKSLSVGFYFYNSFKRKIEGSKEFYREDDIFWFIRYRSNYRQLKAKGIDEKLIRQ
jgi:hypothetical protein